MSYYLRFISFLLLSLSSLAQAAIIENIAEIRIPVKGNLGTTIEKVIVTIWHDDTKTNTPFVLINHGRASSPIDRQNFGRGRYVKESKYLVELGFTVLIPTRIGYGISGGPDLEAVTTSYSHANYARTFEIMAIEGMEVIKFAQSLPYVNRNNGMLIGISYGGAMVIAMSAKNLPCIKAILNISGGVGGNPTKSPTHPNDPENTENIFRAYGKIAKIPTAWVYAQNDEYWGQEIPIKWYQAFVSGGSNAKLYHLENSTAGHFVFKKDFETWFAIFKELAKQYDVL